MDNMNSCGSCQAATNERKKDQPGRADEDNALKERMSRIKHKVLILSGKGGVGKSTVAANLALSLAMSGKKTGLLDVDIHGPSIPKILGLEEEKISGDETSIFPTLYNGNLKVMSIGFMLKDQDSPVIWRGPLKFTAIRQFLSDVTWGDLDYLVIDCPPGTGDEPLSIAQLIENLDGALIVTTPQDVALDDVRKSVNFCRKLPIKVLGVVENMSGFVCPNCGMKHPIFKSGGGEKMASEMNIPFLGRIPIDPEMVNACDGGKPLVEHQPESQTSLAFSCMISALLSLENPMLGAPLTVAIPLTGKMLSPHFGHCQEFIFLEVDEENRQVTGSRIVAAPEHQPGLLPSWLAERGATMIIAGGMGSRARGLFAEKGIEVVVGAPPEAPDDIIGKYLDGTLMTGENICDH